MGAAARTASLIALIFATCGAAPVSGADRAGLPRGFVFLRDVAPGIEQDMRYATTRNFTGATVPGYSGGECVLTQAAARALGEVQKALNRSGFGLRVYDCYRPTRATSAFMAWSQRPDRGGGGRRYHPDIDKSRLNALGYISRSSSHSTGTTVDLTLVRTSPADSPAPADPHQCGSPPDGSVDMGTGFDCFDPRSHVGASGLTAAQELARRRLSDAMTSGGVRGYAKEWWHFTYGGEARGPLLNFEIPVRETQGSRQ